MWELGSRARLKDPCVEPWKEPAESAAAAATAATQAVAALSPTSGGAQSSAAGGNQWYKVLPKLLSFEPKIGKLNCQVFVIGGGRLKSICLQSMATTVQT